MNPEFSTIDNIGENKKLANHCQAERPKENPAAAATANGAISTCEVSNLPGHDSAIWDDAPDLIRAHFAGVVA